MFFSKRNKMYNTGKLYLVKFGQYVVQSSTDAVKSIFNFDCYKIAEMLTPKEAEKYMGSQYCYFNMPAWKNYGHITYFKIPTLGDKIVPLLSHSQAQRSISGTIESINIAKNLSLCFENLPYMVDIEFIKLLENGLAKKILISKNDRCKD